MSPNSAIFQKCSPRPLGHSRMSMLQQNLLGYWACWLICDSSIESRKWRLTLTRSTRLISSSSRVNCAAVTQWMQSTGLPTHHTFSSTPCFSKRKTQTWNNWKNHCYQVSIASWAARTSPNWQNTRALPYSSSISKVSGAVLAQFLQPTQQKTHGILNTLCKNRLLHMILWWIVVTMSSNENELYSAYRCKWTRQQKHGLDLEHLHSKKGWRMSMRSH